MHFGILALSAINYVGTITSHIAQYYLLMILPPQLQLTIELYYDIIIGIV